MNNHYVPQFIIKEFGSTPYFFDLGKGNLRQKNPRKVFSEKDMYSDEVEILMNQKVEQRFCSLLDKKLKAERPSLTREDIELVKRYMLLASIRTMGQEGFAQKIRSFAGNAQRYLALMCLLHPEQCSYLCGKQKIADMKITDRRIYMCAMERFAVDKTSKDLLCDPLLPLELYVWAVAFTASYIAIWDAPEGKQFVLTDCGMNSEYEGTCHLTGYDLSKSSYLLWLREHGSRGERYVADTYFTYGQAMYEIFNFFPVSKKRVIAAVNPFFRMYFPDALVDQDGKRIIESTPLFWPSCLQDRELFQPPQCTYSIPGQSGKDDVFVYERKELSPFETDYLNFLIIGYAKNAIAFDDPESIKESLLVSFYGYERMKAPGNPGIAEEERLKGMLADDSMGGLRPLITEIWKGMPDDDAIHSAVTTFKSIYRLWIDDFDRNTYIARYLADHPDLLSDERAFGFLGDFEKRKAVLKARVNELGLH